jgi:crotonobetainyl-CoA:carnitine CoA-transferase CaiB-like acyl-CoA transferase
MAAALTVVGRSLVNLDNPALSDPLNLPRLPIADIYECEDGRFVQNHGTFARFAQVLCSVMGREEWTDEAVEALAALPTRAEARRWRQRFAAAFAERPALEWEQRLNAAGGCCTMCRSREEWQAELHAHRARILTSERSERTGDDSSVGAAVRVWSSASRGHGAEGSRRTNDLWPRQKHPVDPTAPLSGVRVVDFCIILAGPTCGRTLAELGADVIKVDEPNRPVSPYGWLDVNRGKRSALIDLKSVAGRAVARKLVRSADVVLENYRDGKLAALGLGYENVREINPDVVYASMNAFDYGGGWSERAGWEHSAQAATGMQVARQEGGVPRAVPFPVNDYATGLLAAFGVLVALFGRDAGAASARVAASLARSASFIQLDAFAGGARDGVAGTAGRTSRTVRVTDGRVRVLHPVGSPSRPILSRSTVDEISRLSAHEAVELLRSRGLESAVERSPRDLLAESSLTDGGFIVSWEHPRWGTLRQAFSNMGSTSFHTSAGWPAPDPGDDTMEVLAGLGLDKDAILELAESGVIRDTLPLFPTAPAPVST